MISSTFYSLSTHFPLTFHSLSTHFPLTFHSLSTHFPFTFHSLSTHFPLTRHPLITGCKLNRSSFVTEVMVLVLKRSVVGSILLSGHSCSLGYFPFQPVVHNWFIKGRGMYCSVYGKVHIKDPLLLIEKSSLCGGSGFPSKKCVNVTI